MVEQVSEAEVKGSTLLLDEPSDAENAIEKPSIVMSALELAARFSEKPDHRGMVKLDLMPGTVLITAGKHGPLQLTTSSFESCIKLHRSLAFLAF